MALPVFGTAAIIGGGTAKPIFGSERLLGTVPFRNLGRISYSLYLWHWPILILAAESQGRLSLPFRSNLWWLLLALLASIVTYWQVENPFRHSRWLRARPMTSIGMGAILVGATLLVSTVESAQGVPTSPWIFPSATLSTASLNTVEHLVAVAPAIKSTPAHLIPPAQGRPQSGYPQVAACEPIDYPLIEMKPCLFGDPNGEKSMVLYGDSHSAMWFLTIDDIALAEHWKLWYLAKSACPVEMLPVENPGGFGPGGGKFTQCAQWHKYAIARINRLRPNLVIATQEYRPAPGERTYNSAQWRVGLERFFSSITVPGVVFDVIGNIPQLPFDPDQCLNADSSDVQACTAPRIHSLTPYGRAEHEAVDSVGGHYLDVTPWFCSQICTDVIGDYQVYFDQHHLGGPYATYLSGVMAQALQLPASADKPFHVTTKLLVPKNGAVIKKTIAIDAVIGTNILYPNDVKVQILLTGQGRGNVVIAILRPSFYGWVARWNTASVPNGEYSFTVQVETSGGGGGTSAPVNVMVHN